MRKYIVAGFILSVISFCLTTYPVFAAESGAKEECAAITPKEIRGILKKIKAEKAEVLYIKKSPLAGICEVAIDNSGGPSVFYFDMAKNHFIFGNLVEMKTMTNLTAQATQVILDKKRIDLSNIPLDKALVLGNPAAGKKVIVFTDPECPYCSELHKVIKTISDKRKDIVFYIKMFPLEMHKEAYWKSKSIVCSNSLQLLQDCFDKKQTPKTDCPTDQVDNTLKLVKTLGITGTPAIVLPDGRLRVGALPEAQLTQLIDGKI